MKPDPLFGTSPDQILDRSIQANQCFVEIPLAIVGVIHLDLRQNRDPMPSIRFEMDRQGHEGGTAGSTQCGATDRCEGRPAEERDHIAGPPGILIAENPDDLALAKDADYLQQACFAA